MISRFPRRNSKLGLRLIILRAPIPGTANTTPWRTITSDKRETLIGEMEEGKEKEQRRILQAIFGDSEDEDEESNERIFFSSNFHGKDEKKWEQIEGIRGLWLCRDFLSPELQSALLAAIEKEGWFREETHNQAMRFGDLPKWATELSDLIQESAVLSDDQHPIPSRLLSRDPLFDQLIVNAYAPGEGICRHVDLMRFEDGIAVVSLQSPCVMHFSLESSSPPATVPVFLPPGSLLFMSGEARYLWTHGIDRRPGFQIWKGNELRQSRRISITLRKLCNSS